MSNAAPKPWRLTLSRPLPEWERVFRSGALEGADVRVGPERGFESPDDLHAFVRGAQACVTWVTERIDDAFLDAAGAQLRVVSNFAVGFDNIDVDACRARDVIVTNTPDAVTEGTADVAWMLLMAAARRLAEGDRFVRSGAWEAHGSLGPTEFLGMPISGKTLCIVGAGRIGYATALRSIGWSMRVTYVARSRKPRFEQAPLCAQRVSLEEGLRDADFVSIHTPLTDETRHMIGAHEFSLMKPTAVLVNTARGPVVDESALVEALGDRRLYAAGLDVFEREPKIHDGLRALENVVMTPHFGSGDMRCRLQMSELCARNVANVLSGDGAVTPV
ncbi:MAG: D-glycerate dehydrogenase [Planctomycetota bacterium]